MIINYDCMLQRSGWLQNTPQSVHGSRCVYCENKHVHKLTTKSKALIESLENSFTPSQLDFWSFSPKQCRDQGGRGCVYQGNTPIYVRYAMSVVCEGHPKTFDLPRLFLSPSMTRNSAVVRTFSTTLAKSPSSANEQRRVELF